MPASVNETPSSPSPRISVSLARADCITPPNIIVERPALLPAATGPTRVDSPSKPPGLGSGMRCPQLGQKRRPLVTMNEHLGHGIVAAAVLVFDGGGLLLPRARGSRATSEPHRAHCGTPIGVSALHASQTRPTSICVGSLSSGS